MIYQIIHVLCRTFCAVYCRLQVVGREHMPESGGALLVSNHVSFLDPPVVGSAFSEPIHFLARKSLFKGIFTWLLPRIQVMPLDRGKPDMAGLKRVLATLKDNQRVLLFPEGTRSPDGGLQPAEAGVGFIIAKCGMPVIPLRIIGAFECYPRSALIPRPGKITLVAGPPIDFSMIPPHLSGRDLYQAYADQVMVAIGKLQPAASK